MVEEFKKTLEEIRKIIKKEIKKIKIERDYSEFKIKFNPFPPAAIARYPQLPPLDERILKKILQFIVSTYSRREDSRFGEYAGLTIVGEYGMGKTHLMKHIKLIIDSLNESESEFSAITCYVDRPENTPQRIIHKIIEQLGMDTIRKLLWSIIIDELGKDLDMFYRKYKPSQILLPVKKEDLERLFTEPIKSNPLEFLREFKKLRGNIEKLQNDCRSIIKEKVVSDDILAERYLDLIFLEKKGELSWNILAGYISRRDIQRKEVQFLNSVVRILKENNYNMLYVFIDEFEDISKLSGTKLTNYVLTLNTLINSERHWAVIVSLTQDALDKIKETSPPLHDRLTSDVIRLEPLNEEKAKILIINYLNLAREVRSKDIFPFSEELIRRMLKISKGNYRSFVKLAHKIIEFALIENISTPFKEEIIELVYGEENEPTRSST